MITTILYVAQLLATLLLPMSPYHRLIANLTLPPSFTTHHNYTTSLVYSHHPIHMLLIKKQTFFFCITTLLY